MSDIQHARDVLAKWRSKSDPAPWVADDDEEAKDIWAANDLNITASSVHENNVALIVGTAGNPELLDAIDGLLTCGAGWDEYEPDHVMAIQARHIAAAILSADERMSA